MPSTWGEHIHLLKTPPNGLSLYSPVRHSNFQSNQKRRIGLAKGAKAAVSGVKAPHPGKNGVTTVKWHNMVEIFREAPSTLMTECTLPYRFSQHSFFPMFLIRKHSTPDNSRKMSEPHPSWPCVRTTPGWTAQSAWHGHASVRQTPFSPVGLPYKPGSAPLQGKLDDRSSQTVRNSLRD